MSKLLITKDYYINFLIKIYRERACHSDFSELNEKKLKIINKYLGLNDYVQFDFKKKIFIFKADSINDSEFDTIVPLKSYEADGFLKTIVDKILGKKKPIQILGEYNFRYSPIFWIGKMYIKSQVAKAKSMKDKQEMLKYKILDIKAMADDGLITNEKLEKAIAHYQKEIDNYEYKINKILDN